MKNFEYWIVDIPSFKNIITKVIIWNDINNINVLTVTSASKELFITFDDLIVQIECLVSELQTELNVHNFYEFLDLDSSNFPGYWSVDEDGELYLESYMLIEKAVLDKIKLELTNKYGFDFPSLL